MSEQRSSTALILPKITTRVFHQFSKRAMSALPARAADRSPSKQGKETITQPVPCSPFTQHQNAGPCLPVTGSNLHCHPLAKFSKRNVVLFPVRYSISYFVIFSPFPPSKPPSLRRPQSSTRARLQMHGAIPCCPAIRYALVCTHTPALTSHSGWKLLGARAVFLPCCLHST